MTELREAAPQAIFLFVRDQLTWMYDGNTGVTSKITVVKSVKMRDAMNVHGGDQARVGADQATPFEMHPLVVR